jgi:hypothetical protein
MAWNSPRKYAGAAPLLHMLTTEHLSECVRMCVRDLLAPVLLLLQEAAVLEDCVHFLVSRCRMSPGQLGVITPYAAQVSLLARRLQQRGYDINGSGGGGGWGDALDGEETAVSAPLLQLLLAAAAAAAAAAALLLHTDGAASLPLPTE